MTPSPRLRRLLRLAARLRAERERKRHAYRYVVTYVDSQLLPSEERPAYLVVTLPLAPPGTVRRIYRSTESHGGTWPTSTDRKKL